MRELEELMDGFACSNTLLLKNKGSFLECQFIMGGMVLHVVQVECNILASALRQACVHGILEGSSYTSFKYQFNNFCLRIKAKKLYLELSAELPVQVREQPVLSVA